MIDGDTVPVVVWDGLCVVLILFLSSHFYKSNPRKARYDGPTKIPEQDRKVAVGLALGWPLPDRTETMTEELIADPEMLLNVVDFILGSTVSESSEGSLEVDELNNYFRESRSAYMVGTDRDIDAVIAMMKMIWTGHYRYGNVSAPIEVSPAAAEMIVHQASLLVHWFQSERLKMLNNVVPRFFDAI